MAKFIVKGKRKRFIALSALALTATFSLGVFAACGGGETSDNDTDDDTTVAAPTDTQAIKNGNFEFFSEMTEDDLSERRNLINDPTSWTITTVSPASDTKSGIIDTSEEGWNYLAKPGKPFSDIQDAYNNWNADGVTAYDRLKFLEDRKEDIEDLPSGTLRDFFDDYLTGGSKKYSIDFEDVSALATDFENGVKLRTEEQGLKKGDTHVLMLHNTESTDNVLGTATYATSSTTITLKGGTAAEVSVWVMTDKLFHYYTANNTPVEKEGGAYIAITNTVGSGSGSSPQFIVKNINTHGAWEKYTFYIRANTYATTTYRMVLGLGRNTSSDNRFEAVNGYAFFDDLTSKVISATGNDDEYVTATSTLPADVKSDLNSTAEERIKDATKLAAQKESGALADYDRTFSFDLLGQNGKPLSVTDATVALTEETSGSRTVKSKIGDNRADGTEEAQQSIVGHYTYSTLEGMQAKNGYLKNIFANDFENKFPFYKDNGKEVNTNAEVLLLLSTNGAAYTAKLKNDTLFHLDKNSYLLISFFVKTSEIRTGKSGATVSLIDGTNKTTISAFDSTKVDTVDIDKTRTDIYKGWVQCFFVVKNETDETKSFSLEFSYGPTSIVSSKTSDYADGYAAFTGFEYTALTKTQAGYVSTGTYAKSVSLTAYTKDTTKFDDAAGSYEIEKELAAPASFLGVSAESSDANIVRGLLNKEYKNAYYTNKTDDALKALKTMPAAQNADNADAWWTNLFGDKNNPARVATQPLIIYNAGETDAPSQGYISPRPDTNSTYETLSAGSARRISMRVKVSANAKAYIYLFDLAEPKKGLDTKFSPSLPSVTYWYDDEGNIVKGDPSADTFKKSDILFYLQDNGLYTEAGATDGVYYANFANYEKDSNGNLVTKSETPHIVFFHDENGPADTYYAYREGEEGSYRYEQPVKALPLTIQETVDEETVTTDITRYHMDGDYSAFTSVIEIDGEKAADTWVNVSFYVRAGNVDKNYRLEIWAGEHEDAAGLPAKGYVFVDSFTNESSSNFDDLRDERVDTLAEVPANRVDADDDESNLKSDYALYYTFTFFDSPTYERYDASQDEHNPWIDYKQSDYEEDIVWLLYNTVGATGEGVTGSPVAEMYIDYSVAEKTVTEHTYDDNDNEDTDTDSEGGGSSANIWTIISASVLAVVLLFAIGAVIIRKLYKRRNKGKVKVVKEKPAKKKAEKKQKETPEEASEEAPGETKRDEDDPYNE